MVNLEAGITINGDEIVIKDDEKFRLSINELVKKFLKTKDAQEKAQISWIIWQAAQALGVYPSSIYELYQARGRGEISGFTVPAINIRMLTYDLASRLFRVAKKLNAEAFILEIAKSEIGYTEQSPLEYATMCLAAALKEGYQGPVFIQGDHFQFKAEFYHKDREKHLKEMQELILNAVRAGFYNIDIDASTLVDLNKETTEQQQYDNFYITAEMTKFIRKIQPQGITITIGGEIGEVGGKNSTAEELRAFMQGYQKKIGELKGISKISIQTGTTHGGVVLPDGSIAQVKIDFKTLQELSKIARLEFGLAGCVQHGASTLPKEAFHKFPEVETAEIHLATQFQNIVYENLPQELQSEMYQWVRENCASDRKENETEEQFLYRNRKKALGPFKLKLFELPQEIKEKICFQVEQLFEFLFRELKVENTKTAVEKYIKKVAIKKKKDEFEFASQEKGDSEGAD